jgi:NTE family protein
VGQQIGKDVRIALVLSAGGLRGAAHVGVLRQLVQHGVPIHSIVGVSAGAVVGAYYAAVGLGFDDLMSDATRFRGRHLLTYSMNVQLGRRLERRIVRWCGVIPQRLRELESASFDRLHHGIRQLAIVCHDVLAGRPRYFATGLTRDVLLHEAVRASASIPKLFPPVPVREGAEELRLTDGGVSDPVPIAFARSPLLGATHVVVSDCRWIGTAQPGDATTVWIQPRMPGTGTLWSPRHGLLSSIGCGEKAVTADIVARIRTWLGQGAAWRNGETVD